MAKSLHETLAAPQLDASIPDFLLATTEPPILPTFTKEQHPFSNAKQSDGIEGGYEGSSNSEESRYYIAPGSTHWVFQYPMFFSTPGATCFAQYEKEAMGNAPKQFLVFLAFFVNVFREVWQCSTGRSIGPMKKKDKAAKDKDPKNGAAWRDLAEDTAAKNAARRAAALGEGVDNDDFDRDDPGDEGQIAAEPGEAIEDNSTDAEACEYPAVCVLELVRRKRPERTSHLQDRDGEEQEERPHAMNLEKPPVVAIRVHFFFNSSRMNANLQPYLQLQKYERELAARRSDIKATERMKLKRRSVDKITEADYYTMAAAYLNSPRPTELMNTAFEFNKHPVVNVRSEWHPNNILTLEAAAKLAARYQCDEKYTDPANYLLVDELTGCEEFTFPEPENAYWLANDAVDVKTFFRTIWPHKAQELSNITASREDREVQGFAAFHLGSGLAEEDLAALDEDEKKAYQDDVDRAHITGAHQQSKLAFNSTKLLAEYMAKKRSELSGVYEDEKLKIEMNQRYTAKQREQKLVMAYNAHCKRMEDLRGEGLRVFYTCVWNTDSDIEPSLKAIVKWTNDFRMGTATGFTKLHRKNFSMPRQKFSFNLPRGSEVFWTYLAPLETVFNVINTHSYIARAYVCCLHVYSSRPLKPGILLSGVPGGGKSYVMDVLKEILISGTWTSIDSVTEKSLTASGNMFNRLIILIDELPASKVSSKPSKNGDQNGERGTSTGEGIEAILKRAIAQGELSHTRQEQDPVTGQFKTVQVMTKINTFWMALTNDSFKNFTLPIVNRFQCELVVDDARCSKEENVMRQAKTKPNPDKFDRTKKAVITRYQRDQAMIAMIYCLQESKVLEPVNNTAAAVFLAKVMATVEGKCIGTGDRRNTDRTLEVAEVSCLLGAIDIGLDSELAPYRFEDWQPHHMLALMPHFVIQFEHIVFAIGVTACQHENYAIRMILRAIMNNLFSRGQEMPAVDSADNAAIEESKEAEHSAEVAAAAAAAAEDAEIMDEAFKQAELEAAEQRRKHADELAPRMAQLKLSLVDDTGAPRSTRGKRLRRYDERESTDDNNDDEKNPMRRIDNVYVDEQGIVQGEHVSADQDLSPAKRGKSLAGHAYVTRGNKPNVIEDDVYFRCRFDDIALKNCAGNDRFRGYRTQYNNSGPQGPSLASSFGTQSNASPQTGGGGTQNAPAAANQAVDCPPMATEFCQLEQLANLIHKRSNDARVCNRDDLQDVVRTLAGRDMSVMHNHREYPALSITEDGTLCVAKSTLAAHKKPSALMDACVHVLSKMATRKTMLVYGRTVEHHPNQWVTVTAYPEADSDEKKATIHIANAMHRSPTDITITQHIVNGYTTASGVAALNISGIFDAAVSSVYLPGELLELSYINYAKDACISMDFLRRMGFDQPPVGDYLADKLFMASVRAIGPKWKQELLYYPIAYDTKRHNHVVRRADSHASRERKRLQSTREIIKSTAAQFGFDIGGGSGSLQLTSKIEEKITKELTSLNREFEHQVVLEEAEDGQPSIRRRNGEMHNGDGGDSDEEEGEADIDAAEPEDVPENEISQPLLRKQRIAPEQEENEMRVELPFRSAVV